MSESPHFRESYYRGELRAFLVCSELGCELDLAEPQPATCRNYHLELLHQPTDEHGWPQGRPRCVYEMDIPMKADHWSKWSRGYARLPFRLTEDLLRQCHLRLTTATMERETDADH